MSDNTLLLPKQVEADPRYKTLLKLLASRTEKLWPGSEVFIPVAAFSDELKAALMAAKENDRLARGVEGIERTLGIESRGLALVDKRATEKRVQRISRLLIMSSDGAERFYRKVEAILREHGQRVMAVRITADSRQLGEYLFGPEKAVKLLMIEHKESVAAALLALADQT
ncbi:MAG: hypothetical protein ACD_39C01550G0002 [uncultured bacterium]|nr:MAG: hypothetical protein ACD_39C01550G0002 [uncultured bacterium]